MNNEKTIVIGAGASGLVVSILLARRGEKVILLEQSSKIGRKIHASGNGKCNISNRHIHPSFYHSHNPSFIEEVLKGYPYEVIERFFHSLGLPLIEKEDGRVFPLSLQASSVVELLLYEAENLGVRIHTQHPVHQIEKPQALFHIQTPQETYTAKRVVLATGSIASPQLGGSNNGYALATQLGHTLISRHPTLVQLCSQEPWVKTCAGVKFLGVATLYVNGEATIEKKGDILFTKYGISGLAILDLSREASLHLANYNYCEVSLDLLPQWSKEKLTQLLLSYLNPNSQKPLTLWLQSFVNKKLAPIVLKASGCKVPSENGLTRKEINRIVHTLKHLKLSLSDTRGFEGAEVATGGVDTTEINPETMESKMVPNLFFTGELLDVDGDRGGFNFHFAWVSALRVAKV